MANTLSTNGRVPLDLPPGVWLLIVKHAAAAAEEEEEEGWRTCNRLCRASRTALTDIFELGIEVEQQGLKFAADTLRRRQPVLSVNLKKLGQMCSRMTHPQGAAMLSRFGERFKAARALRLTAHSGDGAVGAAFFFGNAADKMEGVRSLILEGYGGRVSESVFHLASTAAFGATLRELTACMHAEDLSCLGGQLDSLFPSLTAAHLIIASWYEEPKSQPRPPRRAYYFGRARTPYELECKLPATLTHLSIYGHPGMQVRDQAGPDQDLDLQLEGPGLQSLVVAPHRQDGASRPWPCTMQDGMVLPALQKLNARFDYVPNNIREVCPRLACLECQGELIQHAYLHVQLLRLGPDLELLVFDGGGMWDAAAVEEIQAKWLPLVAAALPNTTFEVRA